MAQKQRTFIMIKPDGVHRRLVGRLIQTFEQKGFKLVAMKVMLPSQEILERHYSNLAGRPFFDSMIEYLQMGPVIPMVWEGLNIINTARDIIGATDPKDSLPGTLRGDFCVQVGRNLIHGSDSIARAEKEISLWFSMPELIDYNLALEKWINQAN